MKYSRIVTILVLCIMAAAAVSAGIGIFSSSGPGPSTYTSIRGEEVSIYGRGLYQHMSADVAVQGIGHDYVTLFLAVPALGITLGVARRGGVRSRLVLAGILGYFLVTYLFYLVMGMYNPLFLVYAFLLGSSFFALALTLFGFDLAGLPEGFKDTTPVRLGGGFLIFNTLSIALLWLGIVVPPLRDRTIYPVELQHYTTLIVQGLDLGLLLPLSFVSGWLLAKRRPLGYLLGPVYLVFLSFLMTALTAKIIAMGLAGVNIFPVVIIIPVTGMVTMGCAVLMLKGVRKEQGS